MVCRRAIDLAKALTLATDVALTRRELSAPWACLAPIVTAPIAVLAAFIWPIRPFGAWSEWIRA